MFLTGCAQSLAVLGPAMTVVTTGSVNQALLSGSINSGVKHKTGKGVSEHMVESFNEPIDCSAYSAFLLQSKVVRDIYYTSAIYIDISLS